MAIRDVTVSSLDDLRKLDGRGRIYRGQRRFDWPLQSSLERFCNKFGFGALDRKAVETRLCREFRRGYHQYVSAVPRPEHRLEWAAIMQHHGSPTRLLDFTYSIYVAAYFAYEDAESDPACVWSIDAVWAGRASAEILRRHGRHEVDTLPDFGTENEEETISQLTFDSPAPLAWPVNPFRLNERLRIQKGTFLVPGDVECPYMDNLMALIGHDSDDHILKVRLPQSLRSDALRALYHMNISQTSLFPGLDGYARSLAVYHPTVVDPIAWRLATRK